MTEVVKHAERNILSRMRTWLTLKLYQKSDHIINQCEGMKADLLSVFPDVENKTSVIYNPVNKKVEDYANSVDFSKIKKQDYLLCVGRLEKQKALHYAIEAFAKVTDRHPKLRLKIIGKGSLESELKQLADKFNVADKVDFEGFQKDTISYYLAAKAVLLTSLHEGFPNVLIEAITLGTPIIAFDCKSGPREIIAPFRNGMLVENKNVNHLVKTIDEVLNEQFLTSSIEVNLTSHAFKNVNIVAQWESFLYESDSTNTLEV
jgi:glycosyltransferase involved in cell wall biosynthesis